VVFQNKGDNTGGRFHFASTAVKRSVLLPLRTACELDSAVCVCVCVCVSSPVKLLLIGLLTRECFRFFGSLVRCVRAHTNILTHVASYLDSSAD